MRLPSSLLQLEKSNEKDVTAIIAVTVPKTKCLMWDFIVGIMLNC